MDQVFTVRRRQIGAQELELIQGLIRQEGARGRTHISNRLCEIWDWRQANGRFRQIACRDLLRQLEARQLIKLPPMLKPARRPGYINRVPPPERLDRAPLLGNAGALRSQIRLEPARERKQVQSIRCGRISGRCFAEPRYELVRLEKALPAA